jgi:hypothetical protein
MTTSSAGGLRAVVLERDAVPLAPELRCGVSFVDGHAYTGPGARKALRQAQPAEPRTDDQHMKPIAAHEP